MRSPVKSLLVAAAGLSASTALPGDALACGGFFCSQNAPVNQAAERIVFANDGNGTITAVIQICLTATRADRLAAPWQGTCLVGRSPA